MFTKFVILLYTLSSVDSLNNGLALTPPLGWLSWQRFRCITDCVHYPDDCISEKLIQSITNRMAEDGYLEAGYEYVIIDDCWLANGRDSEGRLQPDPDRFPHGIQAVADYVHAKGLKFGIYEDIGTKTCGGYPGLDNNLQIDANTFADWGVDYLKLDGCYQDTDGMEDKYAEMGTYLNQTGRPIIYSCSFPAYKGLNANYSIAVEICNLWRNYDDIQDSWSSVRDITKWFSDNQGFLNRLTGPGHWNDPDMLLVGGYGLSYDESVAQMTIWSLMAAPLMISADLKTIEPEFKDILLNTDALSVNQDTLGIPGLLSWTNDDVNIWVRPILPQVDDKYSYAFGIVSFRDGGGPYAVSITLDNFALDADNYTIKNVFEPGDVVTSSSHDPIKISVNPSGAVLLIVNPIFVGNN